ncbi:hypothetical protein KEM55_006748 [Ascosphaera atra]|nr:hypothetical protein KEM55_006748 [Ascosphaera atra]
MEARQRESAEAKTLDVNETTTKDVTSDSPYDDNENGVVSDDDDDDQLAVQSPTPHSRTKPVPIPKQSSEFNSQSHSHSQPATSSTTYFSTSSLDGYDAFENTNNKKKRKIPMSSVSSISALANSATASFPTSVVSSATVNGMNGILNAPEQSSHLYNLYATDASSAIAYDNGARVMAPAYSNSDKCAVSSVPLPPPEAGACDDQTLATNEGGECNGNAKGAITTNGNGKVGRGQRQGNDSAISGSRSGNAQTQDCSNLPKAEKRERERNQASTAEADSHDDGHASRNAFSPRSSSTTSSSTPTPTQLPASQSQAQFTFTCESQAAKGISLQLTQAQAHARFQAAAIAQGRIPPSYVPPTVGVPRGSDWSGTEAIDSTGNDATGSRKNGGPSGDDRMLNSAAAMYGNGNTAVDPVAAPAGNAGSDPAYAAAMDSTYSQNQGQTVHGLPSSHSTPQPAAAVAAVQQQQNAANVAQMPAQAQQQQQRQAYHNK